MNITSFLIYCIIATFTPGPTNIVILSTVTNFGAKKALKYTYGATAGFALLLMMSAGLNTLLLSMMPKIILIMEIAGTLYMLYLAYKISKMETSAQTVNRTDTFLSGFLMQFLNPKVVLFALTVIPSFIMAHHKSEAAVAAGIIVITLIGFSAFVTWVLFGAIFKVFLQKHKKMVNLGMALALAYAAVMIWI